MCVLPRNFVAGLELYAGLGTTQSFGLNGTSHDLGPMVQFNAPRSLHRIRAEFGLNASSVGLLWRFRVCYEVEQIFSYFRRSSRECGDIRCKHARFVGLMILLAKCHKEDATGRAKRPSLRSDHVPPTEKSSGYCETATCQRVCPPGRRCQSRCAGRLSLALRAWGLPRPPLLPPLLIPSGIRYDIGMCRTTRRLTFHIHSWRSAWQTIC
jgi:hypothetical protein